MDDLEILLCNQYVRPEKKRYYSHIFSVSLHVRGRISADGNKVDDTPTLGFGFPGWVNVSYGEKRENHVISYRSSTISLLPEDNSKIQLSWGHEKIILPRVSALSDQETLTLRNEFINIHELIARGGESNAIISKCAFINILRFLVEKNNTRQSRDPANSFKAMLDNSHNFNIPLEVLSTKSGYCLHHMRQLFKRKYGISPGRYRQNQRLDYCLKALQHSNLSCKEIALHAGFEHPSHFAKLFRSHFGCTALEMRRNAGISTSA